MPDRVDEVWRCKREDGSFENVATTRADAYMRSYRGTLCSASDGKYAAYRVRTQSGRRIVYCYALSDPRAAGLARWLCDIEWADGSWGGCWVEPSKYKKDKRCDARGTFFYSRRVSRRTNLSEFLGGPRG